MFEIFIQIGYQFLNCKNSNHFSNPYVEYMGILHALHGCEMLKGCYGCFHSLQSIWANPLVFHY
jgi:hypothetical protein